MAATEHDKEGPAPTKEDEQDEEVRRAAVSPYFSFYMDLGRPVGVMLVHIPGF